MSVCSAHRGRGRGGSGSAVTCALRALLVVGIAAGFVAIPGVRAAHADPAAGRAPSRAAVAALVDGVVARQLADGRIPGAVVTVVAGGKTLFSKGYGVADVASRRPMDADTTGFFTASEAKLFTATAAMQLVKRGKLDLHADVNKYLKDFSVPDTYPGKPVTLHNLLTYTSGFDNDIYGWAQWPYDEMPSLKEFAADELPTRVRPPGEHSAYNNYDYVLIGRLIEIASGRSYADYLSEHVFTPLGMTGTTAAQPHPRSLRDKVATGYRPDGDGQAETAGQESPATPAGGDMITTAPDMARFMIAQLRGDRALGPGVARSMQRQQFTADPRIPGMGYAFEQRPHNGRRVLFKDGDLPGVHHNLALLPGKDVGIHVAYNGDGTDSAAFWGGKELIDRIIDEFFPARETPGSATAATDVSRYAGGYRDTRTSLTNFTRVAGLTAPITVEATGKGRLTTSGLSEDPSVSTQNWLQVKPGLFRLDGGDATIAFDESGALVSSQAPSGAYTRLAWYASPIMHMIVAGVAVLALLAGFILIPVRGLIRAVRHRGGVSAGARVAGVLAWLTAACVVLFAAGFSVVAADSNRLMQLPLTGDPILSFTLNTVSVMGVLTLAVVVAAVLAWTRGWWTVFGRVAYGGFAVAAIAFIAFAVTYRLVGVPLVLTV